jgi:exopolyphosphatase/guanosine-5'-triphosphate,3'-diphosphate pyrophosphatase
MAPGTVRVVGTNTLRSARGASTFLSAAEGALGHPIEIISGVEEARLIYLGVAHSVGENGGRRLVVDIGGGSTELIIGERFDPMDMESLYMGCVSLSQAYFADGAITRKQVRQALLAAHQELEPHQAQFRQLGWDTAIGASGTIRAIDRVIREEKWSQDGITPNALGRLVDTMLNAGHVDRLSLAGLGPERAPVFPGGVTVLLAVFEALGIERMQVSDGALREGLLYDLLGRIRHEDVRSRTVDALARQYHIDGTQAARVKQTALDCLARVSEVWQPPPDSEQLLGWAAQLHELGLSIAHSQYHKHGAYILANADLSGFSRQEQRLLATLVRAHRRKFPTGAFEELPEGQQETARRLAVLLRLAALLHRSRNPMPVPALRIEAGKRSLRIGFKEGWLDEHPLTRADLEQEAGFLKAAKLKLAFE